jgi:Tfp pilus assembly protein PilO
MMKYIPKGKYHQMLMLVVGTGSAVALIWFAFLNPAISSLKTTNEQIAEWTGKLKTEKQHLSLAERFKKDVETATMNLQAMEEGMPEGDLYRWLIKILLPFQARHDVEFSSFEPPQVGDSNRWSNVPYKSSIFSVLGVATYHNFGRFLADFENTYPYLTLRALELEPSGANSGSSEEEKNLRFKMEFVTPVKPTEVR